MYLLSDQVFLIDTSYAVATKTRVFAFGRAELPIKAVSIFGAGAPKIETGSNRKFHAAAGWIAFCGRPRTFCY
jgi:hypothetical protein